MRFAQLNTALILAVLCTGTTLAQVPANTQREVGHLLDYVARPGCQFNRNGKWYAGAAAREHLKKKYDYLVKRDLVPDSEAFIERAATSSSMTGTAYQVKCGSDAPAASGPWLTAELRRYRASGTSPAPK